MAIKILMPALSPTMKEGNVAKWLKKEGDKVEAGEVIAEIETDKAIMEVEAVDEGIIAKIIASAGTKNVKVNSPIAILAEEGEDIETAITQEIGVESQNTEAVTKDEDKKAAKQVEREKGNNLNQEGKDQKERTGNRIFASPLAKRIASQENIDLRSIKGSGPRGRIIKSDIKSHAEQEVVPQYSSQLTNREDVEIPISNMRRVIAERMIESKQQVPHFYLEIECMMDKLLDFRAEINSAAKLDEDSKPEYKVSINDLLIKATSLSLLKHPKINAAWYEDKIIQYGNIDITVVVAIEDGLMTPIIKNANQKSILQISSEVKELVKRAKSQRLKPEEYQGGSFGISNLGMYLVKSFYSIINPPQSCIMAVGSIRRVPICGKNDKLEMKSIMTVSLSCDHRVVDGATVAMFLNTLKEFIEKPLLMTCY